MRMSNEGIKWYVCFECNREKYPDNNTLCEECRGNKAIKHDQDKPRTDLIPPKALMAQAKALGHGAKKYKDFNYKLGDGLDWHRPYGATLRHLIAFWDGEDIDEDSGLHHLDCAVAELDMLIDLVYSNIGKDSRYKQNG